MSHELLVIHLALIILIELAGPCSTIHFGHKFGKTYKNKFKLAQFEEWLTQVTYLFLF